jgi:hypothetical protein
MKMVALSVWCLLLLLVSTLLPVMLITSPGVQVGAVLLSLALIWVPACVASADVFLK